MSQGPSGPTWGHWHASHERHGGCRRGTRRTVLRWHARCAGPSRIQLQWAGSCAGLRQRLNVPDVRRACAIAPCDGAKSDRPCCGPCSSRTRRTTRATARQALRACAWRAVRDARFNRGERACCAYSDRSSSSQAILVDILLTFFSRTDAGRALLSGCRWEGGRPVLQARENWKHTAALRVTCPEALCPRRCRASATAACGHPRRWTTNTWRMSWGPRTSSWP